jgi:hypothetical protein
LKTYWLAPIGLALLLFVVAVPVLAADDRDMREAREAYEADE